MATASPAQGLSWSTLMGGGGRDAAYAIAVDDQGLVTVAGRTESADWPYAPTNGPNADVFVARLDPGTSGPAQLLWCTTMGGGGDDMAFDLAMTADGRVITVVGLTTSPQLPCTTNALQTQLDGPSDGFVLQLDGTGAITGLSYFGGDGDDWANGVDLDAQGRCVVVGVTSSTSFPTVAGCFQTSFQGATDMFVSVLDVQPAATQLVASTLLGGRGLERVPFNLAVPINMSIGDVAVAADGTIVVSGRTTSAAPTPFPTTAGAIQPAHGGGVYGDMFVSRFDAALSALLYSTYLGGSGDDAAFHIASLSNGSVAIAGFSGSAGTSFPTTPNAVARVLAGPTDGVIAMIDPSVAGPAGLRYSSLVGGPARDGLLSFVLEDSGIVTAVGFSDGGFSGTAGALQPVALPPRDAWIVRVDPAGGPAGLHYASFFGGAGGNGEYGIALARLGDGRSAIAGSTDSAAFPATFGALQPTANGLLEAFVATIDPLPAHAHRYGTSTPGCRGPVWLQVDRDPTQGMPLTVIGNGAPRSGSGAFVVGPALPQPGTPILGVNLLVAPALVLPASSDPNGAWRVPLSLPASLPSGPGVFLQWLWVEPPTCGGQALSASHALGL